MSGLYSGSGSSMYPEKSKQQQYMKKHLQGQDCIPEYTYKLTDETVHIRRIAGVVWDSKTAITDSHLALSKRKSEEAELIKETAHGLHREEIPVKYNSVDEYDEKANLML